jgi:uncharacterized protein YyaL (SSP411 family)
LQKGPLTRHARFVTSKNTHPLGACSIVFILLSLLTACEVSSKETDPANPPSSTEGVTEESTHGTRLPLPSPEKIKLLPKDGGKEFNRLIFESSPYLLQHARNPIDWRPWGKEAFAEAAKLDKPIFLSVGYTTCHWCHVMEHESFEDKEVAALMNKHYVCIKVDREERPDVDNVYMTVTQMMTGRGGWPMTVIMSPEKVPFFAGTYFPKSSMMQLLPHFSTIWQTERTKVNEVGESITKSLRELQSGHAGGDMNATNLDACYQALRGSFDRKHGGFSHRPKFPTPHTLGFLLRYHHLTGEGNALEMVKTTLRKIRLGGVYDHIGLGLHRYSTDERWLVPHFEKMLYDQALFALANLECFQVTGDPFFLGSCKDTLEYVMRDLTSPSGGFYSAEDADSEGEEGKFYLWSISELKDALGEKDASLFAETYGFEKEGNFLDEVTHSKNGRNIPHLQKSLPELAEKHEMKPKEFLAKLEGMRKKLFALRKGRIHPQKDDKVLTDWNGLMISAFARSGRALDEQEYLKVASKAADFCLKELRAKNGRLLKRWRKGQAGLPAHLEDYAFFTQGLLDLYEATFEPRYLTAAKELTDLTLVHFEDKEDGGFYLTADDGEKLLIRAKEIYDGAIPSGNSVMALNLLRLNKVTGDKKYLESANNLFSAFSGFLQKNPKGAEVMLHALSFALGSPSEIVLCGERTDKRTQALVAEINRRFLPASVLLFREPENPSEELLKIAPFLKHQKMVNGMPTVFICRDQTCDRPENNPKALAERLKNSLSP